VWNAAPERGYGEAESSAADVWAVGCIVFFLLTGSAPFASLSVDEPGKSCLFVSCSCMSYSSNCSSRGSSCRIVIYGCCFLFDLLFGVCLLLSKNCGMCCLLFVLCCFVKLLICFFLLLSTSFL
jgi:serine/threonine protein kinase